MKGIFYHTFQALKEFKKRPFSHLLAVGSVAIALVLAGVFFLASIMLKYSSEKWGSGAMVAIYIKDGTTPEKITLLKKKISKLSGVEVVKVVSKSKARSRLIQSLGKDSKFIKNVESDYFPLSMEVAIRGNPQLVQRTQNKIIALNGVIKGISDVKSVRTWNRKIGHILDIILLLGFLISGIVLFSSGYVIMSTARISIECKIEELKLIKLLGATPSFLRAPVLIEGFIQGVLGCLIAAVILLGLSHLSFPLINNLLGETLPNVTTPPFFSVKEISIGVAIAGVTGLFAGRLALSTIKV
jgi:cell division transport system permease protein